MKRIIKLGAFLFATTLLVSSCTKTEDDVTPPTVTINNGTASVDMDLTQSLVKLDLSISAAGTKEVSSVSIVRAVTGKAPVTIFTDKPKAKDYIKTYYDTLSGVSVGDIITYTVSAIDNKDYTTQANYVVKIISTENVNISAKVVLGAQNSTTEVYKFLGIADNFATYTAGASGTAKANSAKIDFVYYYGSTGFNSFAAPTNTDGAQVIWNTEITSWATKNATKFVATPGVTVAQFDNIMSTTKNDALFASIDFSTGTVDKVTQIANDAVIAFQTAGGKKGLVKFSKTAADNTGSMELYVIAQK